MILVLSTYPSRKSAEKAAIGIVEKELAACVSIIKVDDSVYKWKGKVEIHPEYLLLIKTRKKAYLQLEAFIKQGHPHEVPEIIFLEIKGGNKDYLEWIDSSVLSKPLRVPLDLKTLKRASDPSKELNSAKNPSILSK
jgi:periplasmic divalent cation tolerance protein